MSLIHILSVLNFTFLISLGEATTKYTDKEKAAISQLRESTKDVLYADYMKSDIYLFRWLKTRKFDQKAAEENLRNAIKWRKENNIDNILKENIYDSPNKPFYIDGNDNNGSLVMTITVATWDTRSFIVAGKRNLPIRYFTQVLEAIEQDVMRRTGVIGNKPTNGHNLDKIIAIFDFHGYNLRQHGCLTCIGVYVEWMQILENYYPGYWKAIFVINTPRVFTPVLQIVKPLLGPDTLGALQIFGTNKLEWQRAITNLIPASEIRSQFGGTKPNK